MKYLYILTLSFIWVACGVPAKKQSAQKNVEKKQQDSLQLAIFLNHYEAVFKSNLAATQCPGAAVAIVKDSSIIYMKGFGIREIGKPEPVDVNTVFRIGSLSKGFTSVLVALLVQKGILNWNDRVVDYVPYFELKDTAQTRRIQIKHLLSHSTGLPRHSLIEMIEDGKTMPEMIRKLKKLPLEGKEGEVFAYQNVTFSIIQEIIFAKTHQPLEKWMQEEIFNKANMQHASMSYDALMQEPNKAMPHILNGNKDFEVRQIHDKYYNTAAAGGVNASITDMAKWLQILLGNRPDITPTGSLDYIFTPFIHHEEVSNFERWSGITKTGYGMGWRIWEWNGKKIICHGGSVNDYKTELAIDPENKIGICFMFNAQNFYSPLAVPNFLEMYAMLKDLQKTSNQAAW
jgi:beta-lactamase class C